jgi:transcriptional regulator with XRE-family HTH domain
VPQYRFNAEKLIEAAGAIGDTTGYAIAQRTRLAEGTVSRILNGHRQPKFQSAVLLARTYGVLVDDLVLCDAAA